MSLEVFGDGGDAEDLFELANKYDYYQADDGKWYETGCEEEPGLTDEEMWQYVEDKRSSDLEDLALGDYYE